jgi:uncharacterized protein (DUF58 family)
VGQLMVKQYQPAIARETLVCLDMNGDNYDLRLRYAATELAVVVAASLASHVLNHEGLPVGLASEALDALSETRRRFFLPPRPERAHLMQLLETLALVQTTAGAPFADLLRRESVHLSWGATLVAITGAESAELFDTLLYLRRRGFAVALILVAVAPPSDALRRHADALGIATYRVWTERDVEALR